ncbi:hypothetical protein NBRC10512v2_007049 [Rhodotorula toruloides]
MEERGNVAALVRAARRPKLKGLIYWFHTKTPEEQEYLRPKLERWIQKQREGVRERRQEKRQSPSPELGAGLGMPLDPAMKTGAAAGRRSGLRRYYSPEPFQPDSEVVADSQEVVADSQEEDVVEATDDESGFGYEGDEEMAGYEGTIFADTSEHGGYDPALWLWREGEDELPREDHDLPNVAHSPFPSFRHAMDVTENVQHPEADADEQEEAEDELERVKEEDECVNKEDASPRLESPPHPPAESAADKPATTKPAAIVDLSDSSDSSDDDDPLAERRLRAKVVLYNKALTMHYEELEREPGGAEKVAQEKAEAGKGWQEGYAAMEAAWRKYRHKLEVDAAGGGARPSPRPPRTLTVLSTPEETPRSSSKTPTPLARSSHPPPPCASPAKPPAASEPLVDVLPALPPPPRPHSAPPAAAPNACTLEAFEPPPRPLPTPRIAAEDVKVKVEEQEVEERRKEEPAPSEGAWKKKRSRGGRSAAGWRAQIERRVERRVRRRRRRSRSPSYRSSYAYDSPSPRRCSRSPSDRHRSRHDPYERSSYRRTPSPPPSYRRRDSRSHGCDACDAYERAYRRPSHRDRTPSPHARRDEHSRRSRH